MASPSDVRRLAMLAVYQLDLSGGDEDAARELVEHTEAMDDTEALEERRPVFDGDGDDFSPRDRRRALELAIGAYAARTAADAEVAGLAPEWPKHRLAAVDRAIFRLAHFEMTAGKAPPRVAVDEAVELAKRFSTERSPAFVNGVLAKVLARVEAGAGLAAEG